MRSEYIEPLGKVETLATSISKASYITSLDLEKIVTIMTLKEDVVQHEQGDV
jgi:hypothetical protein